MGMDDLLALVDNICLRLKEDSAIPITAKHVADRVITRSGLPVVVKVLPDAGVEDCPKVKRNAYRLTVEVLMFYLNFLLISLIFIIYCV